MPPEAYYVVAHKQIAATVNRLHGDEQEVDPVIVGDELANAGLTEVAGRPIRGYLVGLQERTPATGNAARYADIILGYWRRRRAIAATHEIATAAREGLDFSRHIDELTDLTSVSTVDELALEDVRRALDDDLVEHPSLLQRDDGQYLLYESATNVIHAEPTHGKSWVALFAAAEVIAEGGHVLYLDYEDSLARIARRMVSLGCDIADLVERFHYKRCGPFSPGAIAGLPRLAADLPARLVVIDGLAEALASQGHDEDRAPDVVKWWVAVARPIAATGACVLILDHVTKSKENRSRWGRGSGAKLGALDGVAYGIEPMEAFSRSQAGRFKLVISKDRNGSVGAEGQVAGIINIDPEDDGRKISWKATMPAAASWEGPTDCMALIRQLFEGQPDLELGKSAVPTQLKAQFGSSFRRETIYQALEKLVLDGVLAARTGSRNGRYYRLNSDRPTDEPMIEGL